jgi:serine O-acetyltransferase
MLILPLAPLLAGVLRGPAATVIWQDACAWERPLGKRAVSARDGKVMWLCYLFAKHREFRSLAYQRLRSAGGPWPLLAAGLSCVYRPQTSLSFDCPSIGARLFIEHGYSTVITAERIGSDCWINHNVTIGHGSRPGRPVIGDGVYIRTGAVVVGPITVGDRACIAANSVVTRDVPSGVTMIGNPAAPR